MKLFRYDIDESIISMINFIKSTTIRVTGFWGFGVLSFCNSACISEVDYIKLHLNWFIISQLPPYEVFVV